MSAMVTSEDGTVARLLFVYGTLRGDTDSVWHHRLLAPFAHFIAHGCVSGRLFDLGDYPGLVLAGVTSRSVLGEVWAVADTALPALDRYEGCRPHVPPPVAEYVRRDMPVRLVDGRKLTALGYVYTGPLGNARRIPAGDYCAR